VVFLGLSKGGFSGIGMVSTPLLALILPPLEGRGDPAADHPDPGTPCRCGCIAASGTPWKPESDDPGLRASASAAAVGLLAAHVSDGVIRLLVGLIALGFVVYALFRHYLPGEPPAGRRALAPGVFWGRACRGSPPRLIQIGAPPYYAFVLPQRLPKNALCRPPRVMFFAAANMMKVVPYFRARPVSRPRD